MTKEKIQEIMEKYQYHIPPSVLIDIFNDTPGITSAGYVSRYLYHISTVDGGYWEFSFKFKDN